MRLSGGAPPKAISWMAAKRGNSSSTFSLARILYTSFAVSVPTEASFA
jgi:hypothetical protein